MYTFYKLVHLLTYQLHIAMVQVSYIQLGVWLTSFTHQPTPRYVIYMCDLHWALFIKQFNAVVTPKWAGSLHLTKIHLVFLFTACPTDIRNLGEPEYDYIPDEPMYQIIDESDKPVISGFNSSFNEIKSEPVHRDVDEPIYRDIDEPSTQVISGSNPSDEITNADYGTSLVE